MSRDFVIDPQKAPFNLGVGNLNLELSQGNNNSSTNRQNTYCVLVTEYARYPGDEGDERNSQILDRIDTMKRGLQEVKDAIANLDD